MTMGIEAWIILYRGSSIHPLLLKIVCLPFGIFINSIEYVTFYLRVTVDVSPTINLWLLRARDARIGRFWDLGFEPTEISYISAGFCTTLGANPKYMVYSLSDGVQLATRSSRKRREVHRYSPGRGEPHEEVSDV